MEGRHLGPFRLGRELGSGGMGTVYLATAREEVLGLAPGDRVALKLVHANLLTKRGFFKRFLREAEVGKQVRHENVVRTLDVDALVLDGEHYHFLVMEYVEGKTLRDLLADIGIVPEALLREIATQTAAGLSAIHDAGIVHRDLKPENVLITDDHQVRIMDLGVARLVEESIVLTQQGQFAGSLYYAAPEQFGRGEVGPAADVYSLGVMLYELGTGDNPYRSDQAAAVMRAHLETMPPAAAERNSEISAFLSELMGNLLAKEPAERFASSEVRDLLFEGEESEWWATRERELQKVKGHLPKVPVRRETELFGREEELEVIRNAWSEALAGRGSTLLLEGETGIGKSRLVDTFLKDLEGEDVHVLYGSYPPSGGMGGLSDAMVGKFGMATLAEGLMPYLSVTPTLVPTFAALVKRETPPAGAEPIEGDAVHAVACHLMRALAAEKPLLWVVDDLHFAEPDSRQIVLALARALEDHRVVLLLTSEPGLPEDELSHMSRLPSFGRVPLSRLGARDVIELLKNAFRSEGLAVRLGGMIALKSDGVPFFVFEMIRGLKEGKFLKELPDGTVVETQVIEDIEVPSAVRDLVEARLRDLTDEDRNFLDVAAVQGYVFESDVLARICEVKRVEVLQRLAKLERHSGVLRAEGRGYRFDHHQIREVVYRDLTPELREEYHALVAEAIAEREGATGKNPEEVPGDVAHAVALHHLKGSRRREALPFLEPALEHLANAYRNDAALELADRALRAEGLLAGAERVEVLLK
ncbi:MAG: serine/threonine-protein kinase, partial [Planctomycetota bacterium]